MKEEIERSWVLDGFPECYDYQPEKGEKIDQGYIIAEDEVELRVRQKGSRYFMGVKSGGNLTRGEWDPETEKWVFDSLWPKTKGLRIHKIRYVVPWIGVNLEFNRFLRKLKGLLVLEIEFSSNELANKFVLPSHIKGREVTTDPRYKNKNLAKMQNAKSLLY